MGLPRSVTRVDRNGNTKFISNVDRAKYTINELCRAALRDCAKMLRKKMILKLKTLPGMKRNKRLYNSTQYWVRKKDADLLIGFKHNTWYGALQELGEKNQPKRGILRNTVFDNISEIRQIQAQYLSAIQDELTAQSLINESESLSGESEE